MGARVKPDKWAWLRIIPISGGVKVSPIHTNSRCAYLHRGVEGDLSEVVRVLRSTLEDHPILGALRICKMAVVVVRK